MNINDKLYGFTVTNISGIDEISATAVEMTHKKTGCRLLWLDRPDDNKSFAITFKTIPVDGTGVFHILEHSVLCGSDKYPLKEPFIDLVKSSLQTYLNAMTFTDKTMYPVSSRNDKDLLNLMDVYLDAVFNPLCRKKKEIFMQEGWHIEEDENGEWIFNGVVYNEMRGVFSSVESLMYYKIMKMLFPDTCYSVESGGDPAVIPSLTYEQFVASYEKFYHPSNATIVLDGEVKLDQVLPLISSYLDAFEKRDCDFEIPLQAPVHPETKKVPYEVGEGDGAIGKTDIAIGWVFGDFDDRTTSYAVSILTAILSESNDSPLKKALLSAGLAEDVFFTRLGEMRQTTQVLILKGVPQGKETETEEVVKKVISEFASGEIPEDQLNAHLNNMEFTIKEQDFGSFPAGLAYAIKVQDTWLYGGDPKDALREEKIIAFLREKIGTSYYADLLEKTFISNTHTATVYMIPDETLAEKNAAAMKAKMSEMKASFSEADLEKLASENEKLRVFRESVDAPEVSALIPHLELSDISREPRKSSLSVGEIDGVRVLTDIQPVKGIVYVDLYFDVSGFSPRELWLAALLTDVLRQSATEKRSALDFSTLTNTELGSFYSNIALLGDPKDTSTCAPYFRFCVGALESKKSKIAPIFNERAFETVFDVSRIVEILKQNKINYELSLKESGNRHAAMEAKACFSQRAAMDEVISGETNARFTAEAIENPEKLADELAEVYKKIVIRNRLTVAVIGNRDDELAAELIAAIPEGETDLTPVSFPLSENKNRKITIASDVSYAAKAFNIFNIPAERKGAMSVATSILTLEYLWNEVRIKGGAYGCSSGCTSTGDLVFASYRDPSPERTLDIYDKAGETLRELAESEEDLTKFIIGAISNLEPIETPASAGRADCVRFLSGITDEKRKSFRAEILDTDREKLIELVPLFEKLRDDGAVCVVGG